MNLRTPWLLLLSLLAFVGLAACDDDIDPPWQLDHDRIIAVRATPPAILPGETSTFDALIGAKGGATRVASPEAATVVSPTSLADTLALRDGNWVVTAPSEDRIAAARAELKLEAGAPVPLQVGVSYEGQTLLAVKTVLLGRAATNPTLADMGIAINAEPAPQGPDNDALVVGKLVEVPLSIEADDVDYDVSWLTSCGTMHDFDLPKAYLKVEDDDPTEGELAVVVRDSVGGVSWDVWPIRAE